MKSVLIVDDSRTSRRILKDILDRAGYNIVGEAINGKEAVDMYDKLRPDIVTMDITMPKLSGLECLSLIRKENPSAVVVMVTAAGQKEKMIAAIKEGAAEFITKPYEEKDIINVFERLEG
jgi:two-component system chemotaxis response regulator CheY